jgi:hypothetical protein
LPFPIVVQILVLFNSGPVSGGNKMNGNENEVKQTALIKSGTIIRRSAMITCVPFQQNS